jgi:hypothetical protein
MKVALLLLLIFSVDPCAANAAQLFLQCEGESEKLITGAQRMNVPVVIDPEIRRVIAFGAITELKTTVFNHAYVRAYVGGSTFSINRVNGDFEYIVIDREKHLVGPTFKGSCKLRKPVF